MLFSILSSWKQCYFKPVYSCLFLELTVNIMLRNFCFLHGFEYQIVQFGFSLNSSKDHNMQYMFLNSFKWQKCDRF